MGVALLITSNIFTFFCRFRRHQYINRLRYVFLFYYIAINTFLFSIDNRLTNHKCVSGHDSNVIVIPCHNLTLWSNIVLLFFILIRRSQNACVTALTCNRYILHFCLRKIIKYGWSNLTTSSVCSLDSTRIHSCGFAIEVESQLFPLSSYFK